MISYTTLVLCGPVVTSMAAAVVVASGGAPPSEDVNKFTAFAGMGAALGIMFCVMLMDREQRTKQVPARVLIGGVFGIVIPRIGNKYVNFVHEFLGDPILIIGAAFVCTFLAYFIMFSVAQKVAGREKVIANAMVKQAEKKAHLDTEE